MYSSTGFGHLACGFWPAHSPGCVPAHVFSLFLSLLPGHRSWLDGFSSSPTKLHVHLSYSLGNRNSDSFQLVFSGNFSVCRCIFDEFVGVGELHMLLLCYLRNPSIGPEWSFEPMSVWLNGKILSSMTYCTSKLSLAIQWLHPITRKYISHQQYSPANE